MKHPPLTQLNGVFGVIKPHGLTAAKTCNRIRSDLIRELEFIKASQVKIGHGGTLDRQATGVLPVGLGTGCTMLSSLLHSDKKYICKGLLGVETDTGNADGKVTQKLPYEHITQNAFEHALKSFVGDIHQVPPVFSALKYKGRRLSDFAYAGEPIPESKLVARPVTAHRLVCTVFSPPSFTLELYCGGGFYVRSLVRDLGIAVGSCAHIVGLERTAHGDLTTDMCIPAFKWTIDAILEAIERYAELQESTLNEDCSQ